VEISYGGPAPDATVGGVGAVVAEDDDVAGADGAGGALPVDAVVVGPRSTVEKRYAPSTSAAASIPDSSAPSMKPCHA
jgi:hypothetical protein